MPVGATSQPVAQFASIDSARFSATIARNMKLLVVTALFALSATAFCQFAVPPSGNYSGRVTVTKVLPAEGLSSRYSLRAQAKVSDDGAITILTTVPESPAAAANVETTVTRITMVVTQTPDPGTDPTSPAYAIATTYAFYLDGKPVEVSDNGSLLKITYRNPPAAVPADPGALQPNYTSFEFLLRKLPN